MSNLLLPTQQKFGLSHQAVDALSDEPSLAAIAALWYVLHLVSTWLLHFDQFTEQRFCTVAATDTAPTIRIHTATYDASIANQRVQPTAPQSRLYADLELHVDLELYADLEVYPDIEPKLSISMPP